MAPRTQALPNGQRPRSWPSAAGAAALLVVATFTAVAPAAEAGIPSECGKRLEKYYASGKAISGTYASKNGEWTCIVLFCGSVSSEAIRVDIKLEFANKVRAELFFKGPDDKRLPRTGAYNVVTDKGPVITSFGRSEYQLSCARGASNSRTICDARMSSADWSECWVIALRDADPFADVRVKFTWEPINPRLQKPSLASPRDGESAAGGPPRGGASEVELAWKPVKGAGQYEVACKRIAGHGGSDGFCDGIQRTTYQTRWNVGSLRLGNTYEWKVRAVNPASDWSDTWTFKVRSR